MCWTLLILDVCLSRRFLFLDGTMVNFAEHCSIILAFKLAVYCVNGGSSSWKMEVSL
jgi:hypothetical protein